MTAKQTVRYEHYQLQHHNYRFFHIWLSFSSAASQAFASWFRVPSEAEKCGTLKDLFLLYLQFWFCVFKSLTVSYSICFGLCETAIFNFDSQILVPLFYCCFFLFSLMNI